MKEINDDAVKKRMQPHGPLVADGSFERNVCVWMAWSVKTFVKASAFDSLRKAEGEIEELKEAMLHGDNDNEILNEYADVIMCVLHSAAKAGFGFDQVAAAFKEKAFVNYGRKWKLDDNGHTYSHIK